MKFIFAGLLLCCSALIMALALDDIAVIRADCERTITIMKCEAETLSQAFQERMTREGWKHEIELRNLDAAIRQQAFENMMELVEKQERNSELRIPTA